MSRRNIYYWKCDRPAAFHGTQEKRAWDPNLEAQLRDAVRQSLGATEVTLTPAATQGNHLTWDAVVDEVPTFLRVENGPDGDDHLEMESVAMREVRAHGVPVPEVFAVDATRSRVPFAWQALERVPFPDLNQWQKQGSLRHEPIAFEIGAAVARWQTIHPQCFGPLDLLSWRNAQVLSGYHATYETYFRLRLDDHLRFLENGLFLDTEQRKRIEQAIEQHQELLQVRAGCLVHKDLALWNILGSADKIEAFIDFDDTISGDPMDDLSLLACFHEAAFLQRAFHGYQSVRPFPEEHLRRFWLHLLRNMIVKAVIRVGAGYFDRSDNFFLVGAGSSGADLRRFTHDRITLALQGLATGADISIL